MLLLLLACGPNEIVRTCTAEDRLVADDAVLDLGFSVAELIAETNLGALDLVDLRGDAWTVDLAVARGEGEATLVDKTIVDEDQGGSGPSTSITYTFNDGCMDELTVPVSVALTADGVDIRATGTLYTADDGTMGTGVTLDAIFDAATSTFPPGLHDDPVAGALAATLFAGSNPTMAVWITEADGTREAVLSTPGIF